MSQPSARERPRQHSSPVSATIHAKKLRQAVKQATKTEKEDAHKAFIQRLETELDAFLQSGTIPPGVVQRRQDTIHAVERALQAQFGPYVRVQNIGLDRFGISILFAPLELAMVDMRNEENGALPDPSDQLYNPVEIQAALKKAGIPVELYTPPPWVSPESARNPFALPEAVVLSYKLEFLLLPPNPSHNARINLVHQSLEQYPSMKKVLALLFFLVATGCHTHLPPLTTTVLTHIAMAYYRQAYKEIPSTVVPHSANTPGHPRRKDKISFYSHPSDIIHPDGSLRASSSINAPIKFSYATPSSDIHPNRDAYCTTYDLLQLIRWWDEIRWNEDIIDPTMRKPSPRNLDAKSRPWDVEHATLVVSDPLNPLNNLATLVTPFQYAEMRRSCRVAHRRLVDGVPFASARRLTRPLLYDPMATRVRGYSTERVKDYGEYLTGEMQQLYQATRPNSEILRQRQETLNHLKNIVQGQYGNRFEPHLFGSSRYGVGDSRSDLDIDKQLEEGFEPRLKTKDLHAIYKLRPLSDKMRYKFDKITLIPHAKVPIIKARHASSSMAVDININDRLGLYNTELLSHYCALWPPLPNLIYVVKKWAKSRGLNDPAGLPGSGGSSFSSYCLTLMVIGFLQTHGILPNLQDPKYLRRNTPELRSHPNVFWLRRSETSRMRVAVDWFPLPLHEWRPLNDPPLGRVFYTWMMYFGYDHQYFDFAIRISEGGIVPRLSKRKMQSLKDSMRETHNKPVAVAAQDSKDEEVQDAQTQAGADNEMVQAITEDLTTLELQEATAQAKHMQEEDMEVGGDLEGYEVERTSHLSEPGKWLFDQFVVGDPFIFEKNCSGAIAKRKIQEFVLECQDTVRRLDEGSGLLTILSGGLPVTRDKRGKKGKQMKEPFVDPKVLKALAPPGSPRRLEMTGKQPPLEDDSPIFIVPKGAPPPQSQTSNHKRPSEDQTTGAENSLQ